MKKLIFLLSLICSFFISCKKQFIELIPVSTVSVDVLYKTDKDFQDAVTGCYAGLQKQYQSFWLFGDLRSDVSRQEVISNIGNLTVDNFSMASDASLLNNTWQNYYATIYAANMILSRIATADTVIVKNKSRYTAEAEFIRALCYFDLVRIFGAVPVVTAPVSIEQGYKTARSGTDTVYSQIIADLLDAGNKLPLKYTGTDVGRATKGAAKALLGKVYLTKKDFTNAESKLQEVTTLGYSLLPNFKDLFDYTKDEHHSEYIFDIEYESGMNSGNSFTNTFLPNSAQMAAFYGIKGGLGEANSPTDSVRAIYSSQDTRKDITVGVKGGYVDGNGNFVPFLATTAQDYTKKYITVVPTANDGRANWKVIRYADVLLMYAEVLNENGKTASALAWLNMVHTRAGLTAFSSLTQDDMREKIYLERRLELAFEGHRWFDLVRTGRAYSTMQSAGMLPYMTLFPIPLIQIQIVNNPAVLSQNTGY